MKLLALAKRGPTTALVKLMLEPHAKFACVTVKLLPPILKEPLRGLEAGLAATVNPTNPEPVPAAPEPIVSQGELEVAFQLQLSPVVTSTRPKSPSLEAEKVVRLNVYAQVLEELKLAIAEIWVSIFTVVRAVPADIPPDHELNWNPETGTAVNCTMVPLL